MREHPIRMGWANDFYRDTRITLIFSALHHFLLPQVKSFSRFHNINITSSRFVYFFHAKAVKRTHFPSTATGQNRLHEKRIFESRRKFRIYLSFFFERIRLKSQLHDAKSSSGHKSHNHAKMSCGGKLFMLRSDWY